MCVYEVTRREFNTKMFHPPAQCPRRNHAFLSTNQYSIAIIAGPRRICPKTHPIFPVDSLVHPSQAKIVLVVYRIRP